MLLLLFASSLPPPPPPLQILIHFRTTSLCGGDDIDHSCESCVELDDTRRMGGGPFEMLAGLEFKLPIWEKALRTMRVGEVASFSCPKEVSENFF